MKRSQRYLRGTYIALAVVLIGLIVANRVAEPPKGEGWPLVSTAAELEALRDFSVLRIGGDFDLTIEQADAFSVSYTPISERRRIFRASQQGDTLVLEGYGNRDETGASQVRITLPVLRELHADSGNGALISLSGLSTPAEVELASTRTLRLTNISAAVELNARAVQNIVLDAQSAANTTLNITGVGTRVTTSVDP
jgi:hypothetical protein